MKPSFRSRPLLLSLFATVLTACASNGPQYQTSFRYHFPVGERAESCIASCNSNQNTCQQQCSQNQQNCLQITETQIDKAWDEAQEKYERQMFEYRNALENYQILMMRLDYAHKHNLMSEMYPLYNPSFDAHTPGRSRYLTEYEKTLFNPYIERPMPPMAPERERIAASVQAQCQSDCGCAKTADVCFLGCGATRFEETVCVANCPAPVSESTSTTTETNTPTTNP